MWFTRWLERVRGKRNLASNGGRRLKRFRPQLEALEVRLAPVVNLLIANPAPFPEGDSGTSDMLFVVTRSGDLAPAVMVNYGTRDGTGLAGIDYQARSGTLTFAPNETTATIAVPIIGNTLPQPNRSFTVELSNPALSASFAPPQSFAAAGNAPLTVALGDLNGDGRSDLAASHYASSTVVVLLNTTAPGATVSTFAPPQTFQVGNGPRPVTMADLNGDGRPDLAVGHGRSATVSVLLNTMAPGATAPSFAPQQSFATGNDPFYVGVMDFNADGRPDVATANYGSATASVLLNTTAPGTMAASFAPHQTFAVFGRPRSGAVGDLNGDGRPDLVTSNDSHTVSVLLNLTAPGATAITFAPRQDFPTGGSGSVGPVSVALADLNGDGRPDLAVANLQNPFSPDRTVKVLLNTTAPGATAASFTPPQSFFVGSGPLSVAAGDLNGDGRPDLATANYGAVFSLGNTVSVLLNTAAAGAAAADFAPQQTFPAGTNPSSVAVGDLNNDGRSDLAVANYDRSSPSSGTVSVLLNTTTAGIVIHGSPATGTIVDDDSPPTLIVTSFTPTSSGFIAQFNLALQASALNLYDIQGAVFGPADVTVTGNVTGPVLGSLVINPAANRITFLRTGGPLPADTYVVLLRSASNGFRTPSGDLLDGNADGTAGDPFTTTFTREPFLGRTVSIPDFMRGPGQPVDVSGTGLPLRLSDGSDVTSVSLTLEYHPALLRITGATAVPGTTVSLDTTMPGRALLTLTSPTPLPGGPLDFVRLSAEVPEDAPYTSKEVLDLTEVRINGSLARDDDGIHVVGYFGDTTGSADYSGLDANRIARVAVGLDSGFGSYQLADPVVIGDITGNGLLNATDAVRVAQHVIGIVVPEIPPRPSVIPPIVPGGPDPLLRLPKRLRGRPGSVLTVPVLLGPSAGLEGMDLALSYDRGRLEVVSVRRGSLTGDFDLFVVNHDPLSGTLRVSIGRSVGPIPPRGSGSVLLLTLRIRADAPAGRTVLNLRENVGTMTTQLNEGGLDLNPDPSNEAGDVLDGVITVVRRKNRTRR